MNYKKQIISTSFYKIQETDLDISDLISHWNIIRYGLINLYFIRWMVR